MTVKLPRRIGHGFKNPRLLDIKSLRDNPFKSHRRLRVFSQKGLKCEYCDKMGVHLIRAIDASGGVHVDVYTATFELMTVDHVIPKCQGGTDDIKNLVPCCNRCNSKKSVQDQKGLKKIEQTQSGILSQKNRILTLPSSLSG